LRQFNAWRGTYNVVHIHRRRIFFILWQRMAILIPFRLN